MKNEGKFPGKLRFGQFYCQSSRLVQIIFQRGVSLAQDHQFTQRCGFLPPFRFWSAICITAAHMVVTVDLYA